MNTKLDELRRRIDSLDIQIVSLLNQRASTALQIGTAKQGQPIHQPAREVQVLQNIQSANQGPLTEQDLVTIYQGIVSTCRDLQTR